MKLTGFQHLGMAVEKVASDEINIIHVPIENLTPGKFQPRRQFDPISLKELEESIRTQGVIQPLVVRKNLSNSGYEIIAGERRWRAAKEAKISKIPVIVREIDDKTARVLSLIENIQRQNLSPIDEALALQELLKEHKVGHDELAKLVSKQRSTITNILRLLNLETQVQTMLDNGQLEVGHAKVLLGLEKNEQLEAAHIVVKKQLSVRQTEYLVKNIQNVKNLNLENEIDFEIKNKLKIWQSILKNKIGNSIHVKINQKGQSTFTMKFNSIEEAEKFVNSLSDKKF